jgi:hypothetical protein
MSSDSAVIDDILEELGSKIIEIKPMSSYIECT